MKYGKLTVIKKSHQRKDTRWVYECLCDCGRVAYRDMGTLKRKTISSCGCDKNQRTMKHGLEGTKVYRAWSAMKRRCSNPSYKNFDSYNKLGYCEEWSDFINFLRDMGEPPSKNHSLDRVDNEKGYSKSNCRWATNKEQQNNKKTSKVWICEGVEYETLEDAAKFYKISSQAIQRWCSGYNCRGKRMPPRKNFTFKKVY